MVYCWDSLKVWHKKRGTEGTRPSLIDSGYANSGYHILRSSKANTVRANSGSWRRAMTRLRKCGQ